MTGRNPESPASPTSLRVRLITPGFPPARGGVEEHCHQLATRLAAEGDRVGVLTSSRTGQVGQAQRADGIEVRTYRAWRTTAMSLSPRLTLAGIAAPSPAVDVTHVHSYHASAGFAAIGGFRRPVVFTPHYHGTGHTSAARGLHRGYQLLGRAMFNAADAIICVSEAEREALVRDFPKVADRIRVIPNGVDRAAIRAAEPFGDEPPTVLVVGRLEAYKHVDVVIRAIATLPEPARLVIIGTGSDAEPLGRLVEELRLGHRVRLLGAVPTGDLRRWMRTSRVLVSLSDHEAFGMVPLEAATAGARVVLSDIPAHREITAKWLGAAAEAVPGGSAPRAIADAIGRALAQPDRVAVDAPDWSEVARATRGVYRDVVNLRAAARTPRWSTR